MKIISHRGYWKSAEEKNTTLAFERSFALGYGTETDIRDCRGELVISHDMPNGHETTLSDFLSQADAASAKPGLTLALNIKADGLAGPLAAQLKQHRDLDCFVFDMSVPDMRSYFSLGIPVFTRLSEVEPAPAWLDRSAGVWLDGFESEWYQPSDILALLGAGKRVCIVSPELHRRAHLALWQRLARLAAEPNLILCTDLPEEATEFFNPRIKP